MRSTLATTERLIAEAQGLAYDVQSMDATFSRLYPEQYAATISGDRMAQDARERWKNTLDGLHPRCGCAAQVSQNLTQDESALADLVSQSQSATGALQAMQATNQLLALQAKQSIQASSSRSHKTGRPRWSWRGRQRPPSAPAKCGGASWAPGTPYTPQSVNFYNN
ncbi:P-type conjugative transfer protein TrbJ [Enterobacter cloacae complex sp. 288G10]|uniref:P-type conjugative transfer protein TrbJ n=1 Tax=Enterobacter cloacae complex sp. 288G10 TaxID=3395859 RepID=UPI003CF0C679